MSITQPGGFTLNEDSIQAANRLGLATVLTNTRHLHH